MVKRHFVLIPDADDQRVTTVPVQSESSLPQLQDLVGGLIEICAVRTLRRHLCLVANEEGRLDGLPINKRASRLYGYPGIVGPAVIAELTGANVVGLGQEELVRLERLTAALEREAAGGYWRIEGAGPPTLPPGVIDLSAPPWFMVVAHGQVQLEAVKTLFGLGPATQANRQEGDRVLHPTALTESGDPVRGTVVAAGLDWLVIRYDNGVIGSGTPRWWPTLVLPDCIDVGSEANPSDIDAGMLGRLETRDGEPLGLYQAAASLFASVTSPRVGESLLVHGPWDSTGLRLYREAGGWRAESEEVERGLLRHMPVQGEPGRMPVQGEPRPLFPEKGLDRSP